MNIRKVKNIFWFLFHFYEKFWHKFEMKVKKIKIKHSSNDNNFSVIFMIYLSLFTNSSRIDVTDADQC